jgi:hypothetical protein
VKTKSTAQLINILDVTDADNQGPYKNFNHDGTS